MFGECTQVQLCSTSSGCEDSRQATELLGRSYSKWVNTEVGVSKEKVGHQLIYVKDVGAINIPSKPVGFVSKKPIAFIEISSTSLRIWLTAMRLRMPKTSLKMGSRTTLLSVPIKRSMLPPRVFLMVPTIAALVTSASLTMTSSQPSVRGLPIILHSASSSSVLGNNVDCSIQ